MRVIHRRGERVALERVYILAFFTQHLGHRHERIPDGPSRRDFEMVVER
jgi:hypothetical protein